MLLVCMIKIRHISNEKNPIPNVYLCANISIIDDKERFTKR